MSTAIKQKHDYKITMNIVVINYLQYMKFRLNLYGSCNEQLLACAIHNICVFVAMGRQYGRKE